MRTGSFIAVAVGAALLTSVPAQADQLPSGADLLDGLAINVSPAGIDFIEDQVPAIVPDAVPVDPMGGDLFDCLLDTATYDVKNIVVYLNVNDVQITPTDGALQVFLDAEVAAHARIETSGCLFNNGCEADIAWSPITADTTVALDTVIDPQTGRPAIDATVPNFAVDVNITDVDIYDCALGDVLEFFVDLFIGTVEDAVVGAVNDQVAGEIEPLIEDAFNSITLSDSVSLLDAEIAYELFPSDLILKPEGITILMGSNLTAVQPHKCAKGGPGGSLLTPSDLPLFDGSSPAGMPYDVAASVSDDLANQALYAAWEAGLLCMEISELSEGEPLTTDLLQLLGGEVTRVVTPGGALTIALSAPGGPPEATIEGSGAKVDVEDLRIDMMGEVYGRMSRLMQLKVQPEIAADVEITDTEIIPNIEFDTSDMNAEVTYNELLPETGDVILGLLPTMLSSFLPSLALDPIPIPDLAGITLDQTEVTEDGPNRDFLSIYTGLGGQVDMEGSGCSLGGIGSGGCTLSGKHRSEPFTLLGLLLGALSWALVRRRSAE